MYAGAGIKAMSRLLAIIHMNPGFDPSKWDHTDEDKYGIGGVIARTPENLYEIFGIDVVNKSTERHLCGFVETAEMHHMFTRYLRKDGMGIDYSKIRYRFIDPRPGEDDEIDDEIDEEEEF